MTHSGKREEENNESLTSKMERLFSDDFLKQLKMVVLAFAIFNNITWKWWTPAEL